MEFFTSFSLNKIFFIVTGLTVVAFFLLLVVANVTNRKGIEEIGTYQKDIRKYDSQISELDSAIATYSSLIRIENRAREMGLVPAKKTEYLK